MKNIPAVIFAGGKGVRLGDSFGNVPKALVRLNGKPIIQHLIDHLSREGITEFFILGGYKVEEIRAYFADLTLTDFTTYDFGSSKVTANGTKMDFIVHVLDTGKEATTQSRLFQAKKYLREFPHILLTYADGISDINLEKLYSCHEHSGSAVTVTAVRQLSKFGDLAISDNRVTGFYEKGRLGESWINGGFILMRGESLMELWDSSLMFEQDFLPKVAESGHLGAYFHDGFWRSMDTPKDHSEIESELVRLSKLETTNE
jgi:glucose-1-phosphate cytidylyltransferase